MKTLTVLYRLIPFSFLTLLLLISSSSLNAQAKVFTFTNNTNVAANDLHLNLSKATVPINFTVDPATGIKKAGGVWKNFPEEAVTTQDYKGGTVPVGGSCTLQFKHNVKLNSWYWTKDGQKIRHRKNGVNSSVDQVSVPRPIDKNLCSKAEGTGKTTGDVALVTLTNPTKHTITGTFGPFFIPSNGKYQSYVIPASTTVTIPPGGKVTVPLFGYCTDIYAPPVPKTTTLPDIKDWIGDDNAYTIPQNKADLDKQEGWQPIEINNTSIVVITFPGTSTAINHSIDINRYSKTAAALIFDAVNRITAAYDNLKTTGQIQTPFSSNPQKEQESVIQQTLWIFTATLSGNAYKLEDFKKNAINQYETSRGEKINKLPVNQKEAIEKGVNDFWHTFNAVGEKAKILTKVGDDWSVWKNKKYQEYAVEREVNKKSHKKAVKDLKIGDDWAKDFEERYKEEKK